MSFSHKSTLACFRLLSRCLFVINQIMENQSALTFTCFRLLFCCLFLINQIMENQSALTFTCFRLLFCCLFVINQIMEKPKHTYIYVFPPVVLFSLFCHKPDYGKTKRTYNHVFPLVILLPYPQTGRKTTTKFLPSFLKASLWKTKTHLPLVSKHGAQKP